MSCCYTYWIWWKSTKMAAWNMHDTLWNCPTFCGPGFPIIQTQWQFTYTVHLGHLKTLQVLLTPCCSTLQSQYSARFGAGCVSILIIVIINKSHYVEHTKQTVNSPDRCKRDRADRGSQTSVRCRRYGGYRYNSHTLHNTSLQVYRGGWVRRVMQTEHTSVKKHLKATHTQTTGHDRAQNRWSCWKRYLI